MSGRVGLAIAVVAVVAACSGGDDDATTTVAATTVVPVVSSAPESTATTVEVTTTTVEPTTTVPVATVPEPTSPATSDPVTSDPSSTTLPEGAPPRVTFPDEPDKQAVVDAAYVFFDASRAAQAAPEDLSRRSVLAATMTDPIAGQLTGFLDQLVVAGERVVPSDEYATYLEILPFTVFATDGSGTFDACAVDGDVRVTGDVGAETVVSHDFGSVLVTFSLVEGDTGWVVRETSVFDRYPGMLGCG